MNKSGNDYCTGWSRWGYLSRGSERRPPCPENMAKVVHVKHKMCYLLNVSLIPKIFSHLLLNKIELL